MKAEKGREKLNNHEKRLKEIEKRRRQLKMKSRTIFKEKNVTMNIEIKGILKTSRKVTKKAEKLAIASQASLIRKVQRYSQYLQKNTEQLNEEMKKTEMKTK